jgi:hypothetical protein
MATNAALNAGGARGEAYEDLKRTALAQGMSQEQAEVAVRHDLADEVVAHREGDMAGVLKADRLQPVDIEIIRRLRHLRLAVALGSL